MWSKPSVTLQGCSYIFSKIEFFGDNKKIGSERDTERKADKNFPSVFEINKGHAKVRRRGTYYYKEQLNERNETMPDR